MANLVKEYEQEAEAVYAHISDENPAMSPAEWESRMAAVLAAVHKPEKANHLEIAKRVVASRV